MTRLLNRFFSLLWKGISPRPWTIVIVGVVLAVTATVYASLFLRLDSNQDSLVSPDVPFQKEYLAQNKNFGDQEYLFVVIRTPQANGGKKRAEAFADSLASKLNKHPDMFRAVYYAIDPRELGDSMLLYASPEEAGALAQTLTELAPSIKRWHSDPSLPGFLSELSGLMEPEHAGALAASPELSGQAFQPLSKLLSGISRTLEGSSTPAPDLGLSATEYFFTRNGKLLIMRILPAKDFQAMDVIGKPLSVLREELELTRKDFPDVDAGLTGRPVLHADEMATTDADMTRASILAVIIVGLLFTLVLHGWLRPLLVMLSLGMAMAWTFGFATLVLGSLNLLSIVFALVLVGIGVDFGVHIVMRYVEEYKSCNDVDQSVCQALTQTGPGVVLGAITSVCAFYAVSGSDFIGLAELGILGGTGILLCLLSMLTVLPSLLLIAGRNNWFPASTPRITALPFLDPLLKRPVITLVAIVVLTLAALPGLFKTGFSYNLLELQAEGLEAIKYEHVLIDESEESTWYGVVVADTLAEVERLTEEFNALPTVSKVSSILDFIPSDQQQKHRLYVAAAKALGEPIRPAELDKRVDSKELLKALKSMQTSLEDMEETLFAAGATSELVQLQNSLDSLDTSIEILEKDPAAAQRLTPFARQFAEEVSSSLNRLVQLLQASEISLKDIPKSMRGIYIGNDGRFQIKITPKENVWDFEKLQKFVADVRAIAPNMTGVPITVLEASRLMHTTFLEAAVATLVLVAIFLWLSTRSIRATVFTMLPLLLSILWLLEFMGWFNVSFNLANFFAIPILIAIGVDGGVHLYARWNEEDCRDRIYHTSTPTAVVLSFCTTMIGFGGLLFAHHRGLQSLGAVMVLGSLLGMLACLLAFPAAMRLFYNKTSKDS